MPTTIEAVPLKRVRIESIGIVRGAVMILMALDHVRDFFGKPGLNPTDLAATTVPLFFTRWITHFCAPVFFLLTGTGAYLTMRTAGWRGRPRERGPRPEPAPLDPRGHPPARSERQQKFDRPGSLLHNPCLPYHRHFER